MHWLPKYSSRSKRSIIKNVKEKGKAVMASLVGSRVEILNLSNEFVVAAVKEAATKM